MNIQSNAQRARYIRLASHDIARGMRLGNFRSLFRSQGIEFESVRDYFLGDDIRSIDWNVSARMGKPFVKVFREERELSAFFIVDASLSMTDDFSNRFLQAFDIASLLVYACGYISSPIGSVLFHGEIEHILPIRLGQNHILTFLKQLQNVMLPETKRMKGSVLAQAISAADKLLRRNRSLVFIISDFRSAGYEQALTMLAHTHDVIAIRITDPSDKKIPITGTVLFSDPETNGKIRLPTHMHSFMRDWEQYADTYMTQWLHTCKKCGAFTLPISTKEDAAIVLSRFFTSREKNK